MAGMTPGFISPCAQRLCHKVADALIRILSHFHESRNGIPVPLAMLPSQIADSTRRRAPPPPPPPPRTTACMFISLPISCREYPRQGSREEVFRSAEARPLAAD